MFRQFIFLICTAHCAIINQQILFDHKFSPPAAIPPIQNTYYSVPLNQTISRPIIATLRARDGSLITSGHFANDIYKVVSLDSKVALNLTNNDPWQTSGGKLCQRAIWWEDYPTKFDTSRVRTRCGENATSTTLLAYAFKGRLILDGLFHQHNVLPTQTRILRVSHNSDTFYSDTNPFQITRAAEYIEVYVQVPKQIVANQAFSLTVRIRDQAPTEVDTGLDSIAVVQLSIPNSFKVFYNTEEKQMILKRTSIRIGGTHARIYQSNQDTLIRKIATRGTVKFDDIRILDPIKQISLNVTMLKARAPWPRIPNCKTCYNDFGLLKYINNATEFTFLGLSVADAKLIGSVSLSDPFEVLVQSIRSIDFSQNTKDTWARWTDPVTKTVPVIKNVKIPGEIELLAFDTKGNRIYGGRDANFTLYYETIPKGICLSYDITRTVVDGRAFLSLSFCQTHSNVKLAVTLANNAAVTVTTVSFSVVSTINVAHIGNFHAGTEKDDDASYIDTFLRFAVQDINEGSIFKYFSQTGFSINLVSFNTMNDAETAFAQISNFTDVDAPPASRYQLVVSSASDEIAKLMNVKMMAAAIPCISTANTDTEFSDKFMYPYFNRICWSESTIWKSFAMAARDRNWYRVVLVRDEWVKLSATFIDVLGANGIVVAKEVIIPAVSLTVKNNSDVIHFEKEMQDIKYYMCKVIILFADAKSQPYILTAAQVAGVGSAHGYQWVLISKYIWKFPFTNTGPCSDNRLSCTNGFKGIYLMFETYNVSGYLGDDWNRVLTHYYVTNNNDIPGGRINHAPYENGGTMSLGYDAISVFVDAFLKVVLNQATVTEYSITNAIRQSEVDGLSGKIKINDKGDRTGFIGILAQINPKHGSSDQQNENDINYIHLIKTISDDVQLEIPFEGTNTLYNNVAKLYLPPSRKYNKIKYTSLSGSISLKNMSFIRNPCEPWPSQSYARFEKVIPIYICDKDCGFKLLSDSNVTDYDSGICSESNVCQCKSGYAGESCTRIICYCLHGKCLEPYTCICEPGWVGEKCEEAVCNRCNHGKCVSPHYCSCDSPWIGSACDINGLIVFLPLLLILILLLILAFFLLRKFIRHTKYHDMMTNNKWIVDWDTVESCHVIEYERTWLVVSPVKKACYFNKTYRWKDKTWFVKFIPSNSIPINETIVRREMYSLLKIKHKNLVSYGGACLDAPNVSLFLPVGERGSLADVLSLETVDFSWDFRYSFMKDICSGMNYLHHRTSIGSHGRLKSQNCLVDYKWTIRISGYGAPTIRFGSYRNDLDAEIEDMKQFFWTAPELQHNISNLDAIQNGSKAGDVFAFAIIVSEILTRRNPYAYELRYISERSMLGMIRDYTSPALKNSRLKWRELAGPNKKYVRPIIAEENLGFNIAHRNIIRRMLADAWNQNPSMRPSFKKLLTYLHAIHMVKIGSIENHVNLLVTYSKNLEIIMMDRMIELEASADKYELLISQMLPKRYAAEIIKGQKVPPEEFQSLTVFASDIFDFYSISKSSTPHEIVNLLNEIYHLFEQVVSIYSVYKFDTINEFHTIVGGMDGSSDTANAGEIADMALDLMTSLNAFKIPHKRDMTIKARVGIHSGPAFIGIVGKVAPRYCVLGETVEIAFRMLKSSEPSRIHVSEDTANLLKKGKGYDLQTVANDKTSNSNWLWGKENYKSLRHTSRKNSVK